MALNYCRGGSRHERKCQPKGPGTGVDKAIYGVHYIANGLSCLDRVGIARFPD